MCSLPPSSFRVVCRAIAYRLFTNTIYTTRSRTLPWMFPFILMNFKTDPSLLLLEEGNQNHDQGWVIRTQWLPLTVCDTFRVKKKGRKFISATRQRCYRIQCDLIMSISTSFKTWWGTKKWDDFQRICALLHRNRVCFYQKIRQGWYRRSPIIYLTLQGKILPLPAFEETTRLKRPADIQTSRPTIQRIKTEDLSFDSMC